MFVMFASILYLTMFGGMIAEGITSVGPGERIEGGFRMFTLYTLPEACAATLTPSRLEAGVIHLKIGDQFLLTDAVVTAHRLDGTIIPKVPISITESDDSSDVLVQDPHQDRITYIAKRSGQRIFFISYLCDDQIKIATQLVVDVT